MITINGENELVQIESYAQLLERPRFLENLDTHVFKITKLIGIYSFKEPVKCGLSHCHHMHNRGFLSATEEGIETNIGHVCGRSLLGAANFDALKRVLNKDLREKRNREVVRAFQGRIPEIKAAIHELNGQSFGARWAWLTLAQLELPHRVWPRLERMVRDDDGSLMIEREATEEEIAREETRLGKNVERPLYLQVLAGYIEGVLAKRGPNNLRDLITYGLSANLDRIEKIDVDTAKPGVLAGAAKWIPECDLRLADARLVLDHARRFLTRNNLMQFRHVLNTSESEELARHVAHLPQAYQFQEKPAA